MTPIPRMRAALTALLILAPLTLVDAAQDKVRPDQVYVRHPRTGAVSITNAVVQTNGLKDVVVVDARGGEDKIPSGRVVRIIWGAAPPTLTDADKYFDRGDWPNAAKGYLATFGDASARDVVKAAARVRAAESLLRWGATDPHQFVQAAEQARGFLNDHATNRDVPEAQMLEARALLLSGKPTDAAAGYRLVFDQYAADQTAAGYDPMTCMRAGLLAGRAALVSADTLAAREMFTALDTAVGPLVAGLDPDDVKRLELQAIVDEAILGEGFAELAAGNSKPALTFFKNKASSVDAKTTDTLRSLAALGLGEALLAEGKAREAQMQFARVSALDHTDRDRVARAHLRLAECELKLLDQDFKQRARQWLEAIGEHYGDTPSAAAARDLLATLGS